MYIWKIFIFITYLFMLMKVNVACIIAEMRTFLKGTSKKSINCPYYYFRLKFMIEKLLLKVLKYQKL